MADWDRMILIQNQIFPLLEILGKSSGITVTKSLLKRLKRIKEYASWSAVAAHLDHIVDHHLGDDKEA
jgi:hypothetical protein